MGAIQYRREDRRLAVLRSDSELLVVLDDKVLTIVPAETTVADLVRRLPPNALPPVPSPRNSPEGLLYRLVLEIPRSFSAAPWERLLVPFAAGRQVVRVAAGRPSVSGPLQPPLRVLQVTAGPPAVPSFVDAAVSEVRLRFPGVSAVEARAVAPMPVGPAELLLGLGWSTVDLLHCDGALADPPWLTAAGELGSLGWIEQLVHLAQCRLLVLEPKPDADTGAIRAVADRVARRGGPAVVVPTPSDPGLRPFYRAFLHDVPVDGAAAELDAPMVIAGAGREEAVRISAIAERLVREREAVLAAAPEAAGDLAELTAEWHSHTFRASGRLALYPVTARLDRLRRQVRRPKPSLVRIRKKITLS